MEQSVEKSIFEKLVQLKVEIDRLQIDKSNRHRFLSWSLRVSVEFRKLFGRDSALSNDYIKLTEYLRPLKDFPTQLLVERIEYFNKFFTSISKYYNSDYKLDCSVPSEIPNNKNIFIIHGHDELNTRRLLNLVQNDFSLNPVAIFMKPGQSKIILEKFEYDASTCCFAIALFSKDDEVQKMDESYFQARPNVIYESGWFTGRLGKNRIVLLLQNGVKIHSDLEGISRIQFEMNIEEKYKEIRNELIAAKLI